MSSFNAKNLAYIKQEPSFLRKLREQHGSDRSNVQIARPKKDRLKTSDGDEDEPTIVDESGETVEKAEWEERLKKEQEGPGADQKAGNGDGDDGYVKSLETNTDGREKQQIADLGATKKRKVGRVIGSEGEGGAMVSDDKKVEKKTTSTTIKKRPKKIKLSFDEPD